MFSVNNMPSSATVLTTYASVAGSMMLFRSIANEFIPYQLQTYISSTFRNLFFDQISTRLILVIEEVDGLSRNQVYEAAEIFLRTKIPPTIERLRVTKAPRDKNLTIRIGKGEEIIDVYQGIHLKWKFVCSESKQDDPQRSDQRYFELSFHKRHKDLVLESYLPCILNRSKILQEENNILKLHTLGALFGYRNGGGGGGGGGGSGVWGSINLEHPATFDTVAMDPTMKKELMEDLDRFVRRRDFYKKVGKAWKRGYLLFGPPGTGKSSLIAAIANYLHFDIYDLELAHLQCNAELRRLLVSTNNRSILVVEDIDCSTVEFENRDMNDQNAYDTKLTLSGLLNFIDGLWSSCGDERIIIFTTNHKDRLDPALLRPGRMDMHIHMSYCTFDGFELLASNYLPTHNHNHNEHFAEIKTLMEKSQITPAEVAEELMKSDDVDIALGGVVKLLKRKKIEENETKIEADGETECQETKRQRIE